MRAQGLKWAIYTALKTFYEHPECFQAMQRRGMERDSSWDLAAQQYEQCMNWAAFDLPYCK
jgi:starch synthase